MADQVKSWHQRLWDLFNSARTRDDNGNIQSGNDRIRTEVFLGDSQARDAFGRLRVSEPFGIFENKGISSRRKNLIWEERVIGAIIVHGAVTGGPFQVGETITGGTSGQAGTVTAVNAGSIVYDTKDNDFTDGETITGGTSGATATVTSHDTGADITFQYDRASTYLKLGTALGQKVIRQTIRYFEYVPGKSHQINMTGVWADAKANLKQTVIYGDALNGLGFVIDETTAYALRRTSITGSAVDNLVAQSDWNIDTLDGTGPSEITLDITKSQINAIDFEWLGVGRVRMALNINGQNVTIHEFDNANETAGVYMRTPTLPVRYEIENTGTTASASTLEQICVSVASEGGYVLPGVEYAAAHTFAQERSIDAANGRTPIFAIRLKSEFPTGKLNRRQVKFLRSSFNAEDADAQFEIVHVHVPNNPTANWISRGTYSAVEYSVDITATGATVEHVVDIVPNVNSGQAGKGGDETLTSSDFINEHNRISQNLDSDNSQMIVVYATSRTGTARVMSALTWIESE